MAFHSSVPEGVCCWFVFNCLQMILYYSNRLWLVYGRCMLRHCLSHFSRFLGSFQLHQNSDWYPYLFFLTAAINVAHNTTVKFECRGREPYPYWLINETVARRPQYTVGVDDNTGDFIGELVINGNKTCGTLDLRCELRGQTTYSTMLTIQGQLHGHSEATC